MISHQDLIENKFLRTYIRIIEKARSTVYSGYTEKHHVLPSSMGGTDEDSNLVKVSAREHFILHCLLTRCTTGASFYSMARAFNMMGGFSSNAQAEERYMNSRLFEANKVVLSLAMSAAQTGTKNSQFGKFWYTDPTKTFSKKFPKEEETYLLSQGWSRGRTSMEFIEKAKMANEHSNRKIPTRHLLGQVIRIHKNGELLHVREFWFLEDYCADGWRVISTEAFKGRIWVRQGSRKMMLAPIDANALLASGKWIPGIGNENHRGTTGLKFSHKKRT